jgi:hypothetical protein
MQGIGLDAVACVNFNPCGADAKVCVSETIMVKTGFIAINHQKLDRC